MSLADEELFGKNNDFFQLRLSTELKEALARKAAERGTSSAALLRLLVVQHIYGADYVGIVVAKRLGAVLTPVMTPVMTPAEQR
jgi:hypothetical protein